MGNIKNTFDFLKKKPNIELLVKVFCALCISTLVILIIMSCVRGTKADLVKTSRTKVEFRTNATPLNCWQAEFGTNQYYLITKKHL